MARYGIPDRIDTTISAIDLVCAGEDFIKGLYSVFENKMMHKRVFAEIKKKGGKPVFDSSRVSIMRSKRNINNTTAESPSPDRKSPNKPKSNSQNPNNKLNQI